MANRAGKWSNRFEAAAIALGMGELIERLEVTAFANVDPQIHFAILSDFVDAPERDMPGDAELLEVARAGIDALNERFGASDESRL